MSSMQISNANPRSNPLQQDNASSRKKKDQNGETKKSVRNEKPTTLKRKMELNSEGNTIMRETNGTGIRYTEARTVAKKRGRKNEQPNKNENAMDIVPTTRRSTRLKATTEKPKTNATSRDQDKRSKKQSASKAHTHSSISSPDHSNNDQPHFIRNTDKEIHFTPSKMMTINYHFKPVDSDSDVPLYKKLDKIDIEKSNTRLNNEIFTDEGVNKIKSITGNIQFNVFNPDITTIMDIKKVSLKIEMTDKKKYHVVMEDFDIEKKPIERALLEILRTFTKIMTNVNKSKIENIEIEEKKDGYPYVLMRQMIEFVVPNLDKPPLTNSNTHLNLINRLSPYLLTAIVYKYGSLQSNSNSQHKKDLEFFLNNLVLTGNQKYKPKAAKKQKEKENSNNSLTRAMKSITVK